VSMMQTLTEAISTRLRQARLVGWRVGAKKQITIEDGRATLVLSWVNDVGMAKAERGSRQRIGDHIVTIDMDKVPKTVDVFEWSALPHTKDQIAVPSDDDVRAAAKILGADAIDIGEATGLRIYYLR